MKVEGRPEAFGLHAHPQRVDVVGRQLALAARGVQLALEIVERDLADDGVDHVLDLAGQQHLALGVGLGAASILRKVSISPKTLAVSASVSGVEDSSSP
jgi:hypothetical protein